MAYARFSPDSDVHVVRRLEGDLACLACPFLSDREWFVADTPQHMAGHLGEHREAGHKVPGEALERLARDAEAVQEEA